MQAIPVLMPLQAVVLGAPPPLPVPAVGVLLVPAVGVLLVPAVGVLLEPPSLELPPIGITPEPELLFVPAVELPVPPSLSSSGVLALEQARPPAKTRNPTDAMLAYTLIMISSLVCC
jgi:hypothetical protein